MSQRSGWLPALVTELAYASGAARLMARRRGGAGVILKFERVRPRPPGAFQPLRAHEISPQLLHRIILRLKRSGRDIVDLDEACRRAAAPRSGRRFVALTFDGGTRDFLDYAYPLLDAHEVPFTLFLPTAVGDGLGDMWWLMLEAVIAAQRRVSLLIDDRQRHFETATAADKLRAFHYIHGWMRTLPPLALRVAADDLAGRYGIDRAALSAAQSLRWTDIAAIARNPRAAVGVSTVDGAALANLDEAAAQREIAMSRAVAEAALGEAPRHFAYPFGDRDSFAAGHPAMVAAAGFASAVTSLPGVVQPDSRSDFHALPRLAVDGRRPLRALDVRMAGL